MMEVHKGYLKGEIGFDVLYEKLTGPKILDLYAGEWVLSKPTHPQGNIRQSLEEDIQKRWSKIKREVQGDLLAEGSLAILNESRHVKGGAESNEYLFRSVIDKADGIEWIGSDVQHPQRAWSQHIKHKAHPNNFNLVWPDIKEELERDLNADARFKVSSLKNALRFCQYLFIDLEWEEEFGGYSWSNITKELLKLWNKYPIADFMFIDHILDLAHNMGTWLNKFELSVNPGGLSLLEALDLKFQAETPKEYVDHLSDRKIIAGVKRVQV